MMQAVRSAQPRAMSKFDYGSDCATRRPGARAACNQDAYGGASVPPVYALWNISTPIMLLTGGRACVNVRALEMLVCMYVCACFVCEATVCM